jgi:hypothetical protein
MSETKIIDPADTIVSYNDDKLTKLLREIKEIGASDAPARVQMSGDMHTLFGLENTDYNTWLDRYNNVYNKIRTTILHRVEDGAFNKNIETAIEIARKKISDEKSLEDVGLEFVMTQLGEGVFIKKGAEDAHNSLHPQSYTSDQFIAAGNYMKANPDCSLFPDGSGKRCI